MRLTFCAACGVTDNLQHHHLVTRSKGDSDDERNLITLCEQCHVARGDYGRPRKNE